MKLALKTTFLALTTFLIAIPALALAQAAGVTDPGPSFSDLIQQALGTISTWKTAGWLAGATAIVNVAVNLLKFEPVDKFLTGLKIGWWLRPVISLILGITAGVFSSVVGGAGVGTALLIALVSGLGSTGFHELMAAASTRIQAERGVGAIIVTNLTKPTTPEASAELQKKLEAIAALPEEAKLAALANLGKKA